MELRPLHCDFSVLQRADGSCRLKQGNTEVLAAIFGPTEPRGFGRKEDMNKAALKVLVYPSVGNPNPETTTLQYFLQNTFQEIVVHILSDDGSDLSVCCNAISLALLDAGIPLKSVLASVHVAILEDGQMIVDPSKVVSASSVAATDFQVDSNGAIITEWCRATSQPGRTLEMAKYLLAKKLALNATQEIHSFIKQNTTKKCIRECRGTAF